MEPTPSTESDLNATARPLPPEPTPPGSDLAHTPAWAQDSYIQIHDLLFQFGRHTPVKHIAEALLTGSYRPGDPIHPLFTALSQTNRPLWRERVVAIWALGRVQLSAQERESAACMLMEVLEQNAGGNFWKRAMRGLAWGYSLAFPLSFFWSLAVAQNEGGPWLMIFVEMMLIFGTAASLGTTPLSLFVGRQSNARQDMVRQAAAETLGRLGALESIGGLAGALFDPSPLVREASAQALNQLLPNLTDSHYGLFGEQALRNLARALTYSNINLRFQILEALGKVGTSQVISAVDHIAKTGRIVHLRDKALEVLSRLEARKKQGDDARILMRPSSSFAAPTAQLLRPAHQAGDTEPLQLLRATDASAE